MRIAVLSSSIDGLVVSSKLQQEGQEVLLVCPPEMEKVAPLFSSAQPLPTTSDIGLFTSYEPDLCVVLEPELASIPDLLGNKHKVFGFNKLTRHLKYDPAWGPSLISRLGVEVAPYQKVENDEEFASWVIGQQSPEVEYVSPYATGRGCVRLDSLSTALHAAPLLKYPALVRAAHNPLSSVRVQMALLFSGRHAIRPAFLLQPLKSEGYECGPNVGVEILPLKLNETLLNLTKKMEDVMLAIKYVGFVFLELVLSPGTKRKPLKMEVLNLTTEAPVGFWGGLCALLNQPLNRMFQSCSNGAQFTPKLNPYAFCAHSLSSRWLYRETDEAIHPLFAKVNEESRTSAWEWQYLRQDDQHYGYYGFAGLLTGTDHRYCYRPGPNMVHVEIRSNAGVIALLEQFDLHLLKGKELEEVVPVEEIIKVEEIPVEQTV